MLERLRLLLDAIDALDATGEVRTAVGRVHQRVGTVADVDLEVLDVPQPLPECSVVEQNLNDNRGLVMAGVFRVLRVHQFGLVAVSAHKVIHVTIPLVRWGQPRLESRVF